jgi:pullulanase
MNLFKRLSILIFPIISLLSCEEKIQTEFSSFENYPVYEGADLGLSFSATEAIFKVWAPTASSMTLRFYNQDTGGESISAYKMDRIDNGVWVKKFQENLEGFYYTFEAMVNEKPLGETTDPYVKAVGTNGKRGQVIDFSKTNPKGWETDTRPPLANPTDVILYELHIRDMSIHESSGIENKGKFIGLSQNGTKNTKGLSTGIDHIIEMGVTHVHLLPSYDYKSIDESKLNEQKFNWGYDPQNYNVPEGGYSTNPSDGSVRIREFKEMVQAFHENGIRVVLDVVYNHTFDTKSPFEQLVPGYFYRKDASGNFSNASGCGNETASERYMMRKYMVESVKYWVNEYHLDGFRFDLMGIHDIETMNLISSELHEIDPSIIIYGEGWTSGGSPLPDSLRALKANTLELKRVAAFSDDMRDGVKGHVFTNDAKAFISGLAGLDESVKFGIVGATQHPQVDYSMVNYSKKPWANNPTQCINYVSCHDNHTLWDRLENSCPEASKADKILMHKLANTIVLTSQGIPFLHAGVEMLRHKKGVENSFESSDEINQIDWNWKSDNQEVVAYYKKLIQLRKNHPAFRMTTTEAVQKHLKFFDLKEDNLIGYSISERANGDKWEEILVYFNGNTKKIMIDIPTHNWKIICQNGKIDKEGLGTFSGGKMNILKHSALILVR